MTETIELLEKRAASLCHPPRITNENIDQLNEVAWKLLTKNAALSAQLSSKSLQLSDHNNYLRGRANALLTASWSQILFSQFQQAAKTLQDNNQTFLDLADDVGRISVVNAIAMTKRKLGNHHAAIEDHTLALQLAEKTTDKLKIAASLHFLGGTYRRTGDYSMALDYYYQALQISVEASLSRRADILADLGDILWRIDQPDQALKYTQYATNLYLESSNQLGEKIACLNLGEIYQSQRDYTKAAEYYGRGLLLAQASGSLETEASAERCIGSLFLETNKLPQAITHLSQALRIARNIWSRFYENEILLQLGQAYQKIGDFSQSQEIYLQALALSEEIQAHHFKYKAHLALSENYQAQSDLSAALHHYQHFHQVWNELHGAQTERQVQRLLFEQQPAKHSLQTLEAMRSQKAARRFDDKNNYSDQQTALPPRKLKEVAEFINHHLEQNLSVSELADVTGLSQNYFLRSFKAATGKTPHQFLIEQRVERAKSLLQTTRIPLIEIASQCGFSSQSHLNTHFRLLTGTTLSQFRQSFKNSLP